MVCQRHSVSWGMFWLEFYLAKTYWGYTFAGETVCLLHWLSISSNQDANICIFFSLDLRQFHLMLLLTDNEAGIPAPVSRLTIGCTWK